MGKKKVFGFERVQLIQNVVAQYEKNKQNICIVINCFCCLKKHFSCTIFFLSVNACYFFYIHLSEHHIHEWHGQSQKPMGVIWRRIAPSKKKERKQNCAKRRTKFCKWSHELCLCIFSMFINFILKMGERMKEWKKMCDGNSIRKMQV